jgi:hypothetical protein
MNVAPYRAEPAHYTPPIAGALRLGCVFPRPHLPGPVGPGLGLVFTANVVSLGRRPRRPMVVATVGTFCYALPDIPMALHAAAPWVAMAAFGCGAGSAIFATFEGTTLQQQIPPARLARVSSLSLFPAYGIGVIGYAVDGPLAAVLGPALVFGIGAVYGLLSSAVMLAIPSVRAVAWVNQSPEAPEPDEARRVTAACGPPPAGRRKRPAVQPR